MSERALVTDPEEIEDMKKIYESELSAKDAYADFLARSKKVSDSERELTFLEYLCAVVRSMPFPVYDKDGELYFKHVALRDGGLIFVEKNIGENILAALLAGSKGDEEDQVTLQ